MKDKTSLLASATLIGTIIGAGIFAIPYVMIRSGVLTSIFYFLILGGVVLLIHLFFAEVVLRTKEKHRLVGYAERYLGKRAKILVTFSTLFGTIGALLAYIILGGDFLKIIFPSLTPFQLSLIFWLVLSFFVFLGIRSIAWSELLMNLGFLIAIFLIFSFCLPKVNLNNFTLVNKNFIFLPYGVLLFSLIGWNAVPEIESILTKKAKLKKVILSSLLFVLGFYFLFGFTIGGVSGKFTTDDAFSGLSNFLGEKIMIFAGVFGLLAVATSFLILGNYLKNTMFFDYHLSYLPSFLIATFSPLIFFLLGIREFILVIALVGTFTALVDGTIICLIYQKAKKIGERIPEYSLKIPPALIYLVIAILVGGGLLTLLGNFF